MHEKLYSTGNPMVLLSVLEPETAPLESHALFWSVVADQFKQVVGANALGALIITSPSLYSDTAFPRSQ